MISKCSMASTWDNLKLLANFVYGDSYDFILEKSQFSENIQHPKYKGRMYAIFTFTNWAILKNIDHVLLLNVLRK